MEQRGNAAARASVGNAAEWDDQSVASSGRGQWRDHVNELGLPNDGYDYGKHLKSMGKQKLDDGWRQQTRHQSS